MSLSRILWAMCLVACLSLSVASAQDKSVKPGVNDSFRDPDVKQFESRFEVESRVVYALRKEIVAACQIQAGQTVADIGAGTGLFTRMFSEGVDENGRVLAVDISQKLLDHIQKTSREAGQQNVETLLCSEDSTKLPPNTIDVAAMRDVTMQVRRGEVVALLGPSGSGKSTFLTAVGLINPPTSGRVIIDGQLVLEGPIAQTSLRFFRRQHIGFVFQKSNLIPFLSAVENVQIAMELNGDSRRAARERAMELLDYLGVADRADNLPSMLSGGQQQRVAVARALANRPRVILADEPTAALDSHRGRQVMEQFAKVAHEQQAGVIVVTHDHRSLDIFDTQYEMEDGKLRQATVTNSH